MTYNLSYHPDVKKIDLPKIDNKNKSMIKRAIEERLIAHPEVYAPNRSPRSLWKTFAKNSERILEIACW